MQFRSNGSVDLYLSSQSRTLSGPRKVGERKPFHLKSFKTPKEAITAVRDAGIAKAQVGWHRLLILGILGGFYVSFGGMVATAVGGGLPEIAKTNPGLQKLAFAGTFPIGLFLIVICGAELFTGNTMYMAVALYTRRITIIGALKDWVCSYVGNFIGCIAAGGILIYCGDVFDAEPYKSFLTNLAVRKVEELDWHVLFIRALGANWLVNLAILMGLTAEDIVSKLVAMWCPIFAFAATGFEHAIANMFFIPLGIFYGADTSFGKFIYKNLLMVTLGNSIAGAGFVGLTYWYLYLTEAKPHTKKEQYVDHHDHQHDLFRWLSVSYWVRRLWKKEKGKNLSDSTKNKNLGSDSSDSHDGIDLEPLSNGSIRTREKLKDEKNHDDMV